MILGYVNCWQEVFLITYLKSIVFLAFVLAFVRLMHGFSASFRYRFWIISLIALFCLPLLIMLLPSIQSPYLPDNKVYQLHIGDNVFDGTIVSITSDQVQFEQKSIRSIWS